MAIEAEFVERIIDKQSLQILCEFFRLRNSACLEQGSKIPVFF